MLRRRSFFQDAPRKVRALARWATENHVDLALCTGDYTALGTEQELRYAREVVEPLTHAPLGYVTVPGNHDWYLPDSVAGRYFDRHFGSFLTTDIPELASDDGWPRVRLVGEHVAIVTINSARPNPSLQSSGAHPRGPAAATPRRDHRPPRPRARDHRRHALRRPS